MNDAIDARCDEVHDLTGRWYDGDMPEHDLDTFEQHLLFCRPCLVHSRKMRKALDIIANATTDPDAALRQRLIAVANSERNSR